MVTEANYKPDEVMVIVVDAAVAALTMGTNLFAGPLSAYDLQQGFPHQAVFINADGGSRSRPIRGTADERHPQCTVYVRSKSTGSASSFATGQQLARDVMFAIDQAPPTGWCEFRALDSHPSYEGRDDDGHHGWSFAVEVTVDVA